MDVYWIIMLALLGVGIVAVVAAAVVLGLNGYRLYKLTQEVQAEIDQEVKLLTEKQEIALRRVERIQGGQQIVTRNTQSLTAAVGRVGYLLEQLSEAKKRLNIAD